VTLDVECLDRVYLNAYVPTVQVPGPVVRFLCGHRGNRVPSPALSNRIGTALRRAVSAFAADNGIPVVRSAKEALVNATVRLWAGSVGHPGPQGEYAAPVGYERRDAGGVGDGPERAELLGGSRREPREAVAVDDVEDEWLDEGYAA
jgi:hypothetical protein